MLRNLRSNSSIQILMLFFIVTAFILLLFTGISHAATYYVSPTGAATWANCSGSTPLNGTSACSWQTAMANAVAGDIVYFRGGTYDLGIFTNNTGSMKDTKMYPANSGTAGNPITFIAYPGEVPDITGTVTATSQQAWFGCGGKDDAENRNYTTWDGFSATMKVNNLGGGAETAIFRVAGDHCTIRNSNFTGVDVGNWPYNTAFVRVETATNATIENNYFHDLTSVSYSAVNTAAVYFHMLSNITTVRNNTVENCEGGIYGKGNSANVSIYNNFVYSSGTSLSGIWYKRSAADGEALTTRRVYQNVVLGYATGILFEDGGVAVSGSLIYNNTIYAGNGADDGIEIQLNHTNTEVFNNIISNRNPSLRYYDGTVSYSNYNNFYRAAGNVWNRNYSTDYTTLSAWTAATGFDANSITSNPLFVNAGGTNPADYKLQTISPARTSGRGGSYATVMGAYITGDETIGYTSDPTLQFSSATYDISESGATATITVNRIGSSTGAVSVDYATSNGTAAAGSDYTSASGTLNFGIGETTKTFTVSITNDTVDENDETINLTLSNPTNGAVIGSLSTAVLTITDNDGGGGNTPPPSSSGDASASGGSGCGFVKDDNNGKGQGAKGEGFSLMIMLSLTFALLVLAKQYKYMLSFSKKCNHWREHGKNTDSDDRRTDKKNKKGGFKKTSVYG